MRALAATQHALKQDLSLATEGGRERFPPSETRLITEIVRRDLPFHDASISEVSVVATRFRHLWRERNQ